MEKNWLIRTKSNHILGPISKDKVLELYHNGSIKPDDEICSGNGYWFFIREDELVSRYLLGNEIQNFNPISEAKNVLTQITSKDQDAESQEDITKIGGVNLRQLQSSEEAIEIPAVDEIPKIEKVKSAAEIPEQSEIKKKVKSDTNPSAKKLMKTNSKDQNLIKYLTWIGIVLFLLLIYYRKTMIKSFLQSSTIDWLIPSVSAQVIEDKKKT